MVNIKIFPFKSPIKLKSLFRYYFSIFLFVRVLFFKLSNPLYPKEFNINAKIQILFTNGQTNVQKT